MPALIGSPYLRGARANFGSQHDEVTAAVHPWVVTLVPEVEEGSPHVAVPSGSHRGWCRSSASFSGEEGR